MSPNTLPAPTLGNWSLSPTIMSCEVRPIAFNKLNINWLSTILASSTTITSCVSGFCSVLPKHIPFPFLKSKSKALCIVLAFSPVLSLRRLAALPVGASNKHFLFLCLKQLKTHLMIVVLPVPGPPVITHTPLLTAFVTASIWFLWSLIWFASS